MQNPLKIQDWLTSKINISTMERKCRYWEICSSRDFDFPRFSLESFRKIMKIFFDNFDPRDFLYKRYNFELCLFFNKNHNLIIFLKLIRNSHGICLCCYRQHRNKIHNQTIKPARTKINQIHFFRRTFHRSPSMFLFRSLDNCSETRT